MSDFHKKFIGLYFETISHKRNSYKSLVRTHLHNIYRVIYYYERVLDWLTRRLSKDQICLSLVYNDNFFIKNLDSFAVTYDLLSDEHSRSKYVKYICYKAINSNAITLDIEPMDIAKDIKQVSNCKVTSDALEGLSNVETYSVYDLSPLGYEVKIINDSIGTLIDFVYEQYAYEDLFRVDDGDVVIDCGGAIGDTAIYFAAKGASKVYAFEFIQSSIEIIKRQIEINPDLKSKIVIVDKPVWDASNVELSYLDHGNASRVADAGVYPNRVKTLSIDDMVASNELENVDLIKMDIEGAEMPALRGAEETIRKYKPKLAICVYHEKNDLIVIPDYIRSLNPNYEFYFEYYTDVGWEAVLYAVNREVT